MNEEMSKATDKAKPEFEKMVKGMSDQEKVGALKFFAFWSKHVGSCGHRNLYRMFKETLTAK